MLALGLESFLRVQHRRQQQAGYLAFYWRTRGLLSIPTRAAALAQARGWLRHYGPGLKVQNANPPETRLVGRAR